MSYSDLLYEVDAGVATITLNRPESLNAFSQSMLDSWLTALQEAADDPGIGAIIITGAGRAFCAGADVKAMELSFDLSHKQADALAAKNEQWEGIYRLALGFAEVDKPFIAAVNGAAIGGGFETALMCDLRLATSKATFSGGYVRMGLLPRCHSIVRLVNSAVALELLWTGRTFDAQEALRLGLVNQVTEAEELLPTARELAARLAAAPLEVVRLIKRLVYQSSGMDLRTHLDLVSSHHGLLSEGYGKKAKANSC